MGRIAPRLRRALAGPRRFAASRSGAGALEFAFTAPMLVLLLCAGFETSRYIKSIRQLATASTAVAGMIAQSTTGTVNDTDLQFYRDAVMIAYPDVLPNAAAAGQKDWTSDIQVTMSSVNFSTTQQNCSSNCAFQAKVAWSGGSNPRPCSTYLTAAADNAAPTPTTLPADTFGSNTSQSFTVIVVDLVYKYRPSLATSFLGPITLTRSFYIEPRYVQSVSYSPNGLNYATNCPANS